MATRKDIIALPNKKLRQRSEKVTLFDDAVKKLISDMQTATLDWEDHRPHEIGVALAAVQIDQLKRVVVIRNDFDDKTDRTFSILINPEIVKLEGEIVEAHEGCLSVPDIYGMVPRHSKVRIKALNENGERLKFKADGFLARVLQHEIDHTNGIVFIDHIKNKDSFYKLNDKGDIIKVEHGKILKNNLLWD